MLSVGEPFPKFKAQACNGLSEHDISTLSSEDFDGMWQVYFFYPKDFSFICPTEIAAFNRALQEFKEHSAVLVGGSTDNEYCHLAWRQTHEDLREIGFPLIAAGPLAQELGILELRQNICQRATFIVDPEGMVQYACCHNLEVGRNVEEILRVLDALQSDELCPCNWKKDEANLAR
ncbi:MAG: peroxiredoxin [Opitutales bacterium]